MNALNHPLYSRINAALDNVRPYLEADGGNVRIVSITDELAVNLELMGACGHCPMSTMTMKTGIEDAIRMAVPEVTEIRAVNLSETVSALN